MAQHGQQTIEHPIILALELSSMCGSVGLVADGLTICEYSLYSRKTHSRRLLDTIDRIVVDAGLSLGDIDAIGVSLGPGSFTGLRIALSTAKGIAMAAGVKLVGVSSLDGVAGQLQFCPYLICPVLDARKKQVYAGFYRCLNQGKPQLIGDMRAIAVQDLVAEIGEPTLFIGDGLVSYGEFIKSELGDLAMFGSPELYYPRAAAIGLIAVDRYKRGLFLDPVTASPFYVRPSDAEIHFNASHS